MMISCYRFFAISLLFVSSIIAWNPSLSLQFHRKFLDAHGGSICTELHSTLDGRLEKCAENRMLPPQHYSGILNYEGYRHWLRLPHDLDASFDNITSNEIHFTSTKSARRDDPALKPSPIQPKHLQPIYIDDHIIVLNKPSGVLSVPGPRRHECAASLAYRYFGKGHSDNDISMEENMIMQPLDEEASKQIDTMIVHRLDRDTSGVLMLARNDRALKRLHNDFKDKSRVRKTYVALVCGHWKGPSDGSRATSDEGEIDLPLVRDMERPPFMRVATIETEQMQQHLLEQHSDSDITADQAKRNARFRKMVGKGAKPSLTTYRILSYEYLIDEIVGDDGSLSIRRLPVTRLELHPVTGRTHQLRVHCAAIGHPIVGDSIYGFGGEGAPNGGLNLTSDMNSSFCKSTQEDIYNYWLRTRRKQFNSKNEEDCMLCLHAHQLNVFHPFTNTPMSFTTQPTF